MNIPEFKYRILLIHKFTLKMDKENVPVGIQRILLKIYANTLKINLTDRMIDDIIYT
jgi:hypothetical protein